MAKLTSSGSASSESVLRNIQISLHEFVEASAAARERAAKVLRLRPSDLSCLSYLRRSDGPVSAKQISDVLNMTSGACTGLLDRLEVSGYIRRRPNPADRRGILVELNPVKANAPLGHIDQIERSYLEKTQRLSDDELAAILEFLQDMNEIAKQV